MTVILCVDNRFGMLFNKRRISRDRAVTEDIVKDLSGGRLLGAEMSKPLFDGEINAVFRDDFPEIAKENDRCFVEDRDITPYLEKITKIVLYHWNRDYPADLWFDPAVLREFQKKTTTEFEGNSHEKITKEVYEK